MEAILETKAETILQFIRGLRGGLHVTLVEGTTAAWLTELLKPHLKTMVGRVFEHGGFVFESFRSCQPGAVRYSRIYL